MDVREAGPLCPSPFWDRWYLRVLGLLIFALCVTEAHLSTAYEQAAIGVWIALPVLADGAREAAACARAWARLIMPARLR